MSLLPPDDDLELIHTREYETRVYLLSEDEILVRGAISDTKPPGLYVLGDTKPLEMHQMQLELHVALPTLEITSARVLFETHPHSKCPMIAADYEKLVGLSIARGFTRKIRDLFGGPKGCTHTNALLQAIAPAVVQSTWSVSIRNMRRDAEKRSEATPEQLERRIRANQNTCHIWSEEGEHVASLRRGEIERDPLLPLQKRLQELGVEDDIWS